MKEITKNLLLSMDQATATTSNIGQNILTALHGIDKSIDNEIEKMTVTEIQKIQNIIQSKLCDIKELISESKRLMRFGDLFNGIRFYMNKYTPDDRINSDYIDVELGDSIQKVLLYPYGKNNPHIIISITHDNVISVEAVMEERLVKPIIDIYSNSGSELSSNSSNESLKDKLRPFFCLRFVINIHDILKHITTSAMNVNEIDDMIIWNILGMDKIIPVKTRQIPKEEMTYESLVEAFKELAYEKLKYNCAKVK